MPAGALLAALDAFVEEHGEDPSRPEALRLILADIDGLWAVAGARGTRIEWRSRFSQGGEP